MLLLFNQVILTIFDCIIEHSVPMPSPGDEGWSHRLTDEEGIDKPIILDWLIISVFQNKKTKPPFSDFVFTLRQHPKMGAVFKFIFLCRRRGRSF